MSSKTTGHFAAKHPEGTVVDPLIAKAVQDKLVNQTITCAAAHKIAKSLGVAPHDVGVAIDLQEGRLLKCQLGLFGYGDPKKVVQPAQQVDAVLRERLFSATMEGRLPCREVWRIADDMGVPRMDISAACEHLQIRIKPCQIGAF